MNFQSLKNLIFYISYSSLHKKRKTDFRPDSYEISHNGKFGCDGKNWMLDWDSAIRNYIETAGFILFQKKFLIIHNPIRIAGICDRLTHIKHNSVGFQN